ncbi:alpha/beta fold hydrolase [Aurantiacibacter aquimixticola]|nr:alpha/beta fold hydrolase [Aurantiacibacter aquimixticola]
MGEGVTCGYLTLPDSGAQLHYRRSGSGPPLIMLHPSPQSSEALEPAMAHFGKVCTCIALDTPGYGLSDDPTPDNASLADYAEVIFAAADALGLDRFFLYGAATGAQIAIEMGKHRPKRLALVLLDANGHIDAAERERVMRGYFPAVAPRRDGGHLLTLWDMCSGLFSAFPWNSDRPEDRLPIPRFPPEAIHAILLRYLDAGEDYAKAYRKAFEAEDIAHFTGFTASAVMTRWDGSAVLRIADDLIAQGLPKNVRLLRAGPSLEERYAVQLEALSAAIGEEHFPAPDFEQRPPSGPHRAYLETEVGQLHCRRSDAGKKEPIVMLHGAGSSCRQWLDYPESISERWLIAIDLPGHGHSRIHPCSFDNLETLAAPVIDAIRELPNNLHIIGEGLGGAVALRAAAASDLSLAVHLLPFTAMEQKGADSLRNGIPDVTPRASGAHLLEAWHFVRERALRDPWNDGSVSAQRAEPLDQSPGMLHRQTADILRVGAEFAAALKLEMAFDQDALIGKADGPVHRIDSLADALVQ